jgi:3-hydroxybutyryl-CoA dehydrogenase
MILGILGPGTLGLSVARHAAERGLQVRLIGRSEAHASEALARLQRRHADAAAGRVSAHGSDREAVIGLDALLEALPEDLPLKTAAWQSLAPLLEDRTACLTGTSSLPVGGIAAAAGLGTRLVGFHPFVPVNRMAVVEVAAPQGADAAPALALAEALGLRPIRVQDQAGFAASRMALAQGLEAMRLLESGAASAEDLDALLVAGYGHPVGPLELSDRVGLDLRLRIADTLFQETGDPRFQAPGILRAKVAQGHLGRKTGLGFHAWGPDGRRR